MKVVFRNCLVVINILFLVGVTNSTELHDAVKNGSVDDVGNIIMNDSSLINAPDDAGNTPLYLASQNCQVDIIKLLVDAGADLNAINKQGMSPLRWAIYSQDHKITRLLIDLGANLEETHPMFGSLIDQAFSTACQNKSGPETVELLVTHGVTFDANSVDGLSMSRLDWAMHFGNLPMAQYALEHGADVNIVSQALGRAPLTAAVTKGDEDIVDILLQHGADVSIVDKYDNPPIYYAAIKGRTAILEKLLTHGASVDFHDPHFQRSLLHLVAINGFMDISQLLVNHESDVNALDASGKTPLFYAAKYGNKKIADYLISKGAVKPDGMIEKYGVSKYLKNITTTQAVAWYLNHRGWALKTSNHMLVFDAEEFGVRRSDEPSLANGFLTPGELQDQNILALYSCYHGEPGDPAYIHTLADSVDNIAYVHLDDDPWRGSPNTIYLKAKVDTSIGNILIRTISLMDNMPALGHLVEVDGLNIYYQAFNTDNLENLQQEYTFLSQFADTIDIAFLPLPEPDAEEKSDLQLFLERFPTRSVCLLDSNHRVHLFETAVKKMAEWDYPTKVFSARNPGDAYILTETNDR